MAGYPGQPLPKKLGIKAGHKVCLLNAPGAFERTLAGDDVRITHDLRLPPVDVVVLFVDSLEELERRFTDVSAGSTPPVGSGSRGAGPRAGVISEDVVRRIALAAGMVGEQGVRDRRELRRRAPRAAQRDPRGDGVSHRAAADLAPHAPADGADRAADRAPPPRAARARRCAARAPDRRSSARGTKPAAPPTTPGMVRYRAPHASPRSCGRARHAPPVAPPTDDRPATLEYVTTSILAPSCGNAQCHSSFRNVDVLRVRHRRGGARHDRPVRARDPRRRRRVAAVPGADLGRRRSRRSGRDPAHAVRPPLPNADIALIERWIDDHDAEGL